MPSAAHSGFMSRSVTDAHGPIKFSGGLLLSIRFLETPARTARRKACMFVLNYEGKSNPRHRYEDCPRDR